MADQSNSLGRAVIQLTAENRELKAKLAESERRLRSYGNVAVGENVRVQRAFRTTGNSIRDAISPLTRFISGMTAAVGVTTLFYRIGSNLSSLFKTNAELAREFSDNLDVSSASEHLKQLEERLKALQQQMERKQSTDVSNAFGELFEQWNAGLLRTEDLLTEIFSGLAIRLHEQFDGVTEEMLEAVRREWDKVREQIAQQKRLEENSKFIANFNAAIDRLENIQQQQIGGFGVGQVATLEAIRGVLEQIASQGRRF
jgi:uncharacterized protein YukE